MNALACGRRGNLEKRVTSRAIRNSSAAGGEIAGGFDSRSAFEHAQCGQIGVVGNPAIKLAGVCGFEELVVPGVAASIQKRIDNGQRAEALAMAQVFAV